MKKKKTGNKKLIISYILHFLKVTVIIIIITMFFCPFHSLEYDVREKKKTHLMNLKNIF